MSQILERARKSLDKAQREYDELARFVPQLPDLPYRLVMAGGYKAACHVGLDAQTIGDVCPLLEQLPPTPLFMVRDSNLSFQPEEAWKASQEVTPVAPIVLRLANVTRPAIECEWWTRLGFGLCSVKVAVSQVHNWVRWTGQKRMRQGQVYYDGAEVYHRFPGAKSVRWWNSPEYLPSRSLYWEAGVEMADLKEIFLSDPSVGEVRT